MGSITIAGVNSNALILALGRWRMFSESELTADVAGRTSETANALGRSLSRAVRQGQALAAMSQEQLEQALVRPKQQVVELEEAEKERERQFREETRSSWNCVNGGRCRKTGLPCSRRCGK